MNFALDVHGVRLAFLARETDMGDVKLSMRALAPCRVDGIAADLGGGGHAMAAGCTLEMPLEQAVELLVEEHKKHPGNPYMFPSPKTGGMFDPDSFRHTHEKILKAIGAEHIRFHDLRHTFATLSLKNGVDVKTLSSTLGHYSAGFTLSTYTHATPDMMREAADTMGDVIGKAM